MSVKKARRRRVCLFEMSEEEAKRQKIVSVDEILEQTLQQLAEAQRRFKDEMEWREFYERRCREQEKRLSLLEEANSDRASFYCDLCSSIHTLQCVKKQT